MKGLGRVKPPVLNLQLPLRRMRPYYLNFGVQVPIQTQPTGLFMRTLMAMGRAFFLVYVLALWPLRANSDIFLRPDLG